MDIFSAKATTYNQNSQERLSPQSSISHSPSPSPNSPAQKQPTPWFIYTPYSWVGIGGEKRQICQAGQAIGLLASPLRVPIGKSWPNPCPVWWPG